MLRPALFLLRLPRLVLGYDGHQSSVELILLLEDSEHQLVGLRLLRCQVRQLLPHCFHLVF